MRILCVGDSQNAGLKRAYDAGENAAIEARGLTVDFLSAIGPIARLITSDSSCVLLKSKPATWPKHSVGPVHLDRLYEETRRQFAALGSRRHFLSKRLAVRLADYDAVISVGGWIVRWWRDVDDAFADTGISEACKQDFAEEIFRRSNALLWLGNALANADLRKKILFMPDPLANELSPEAAGSPSRTPDIRPVFAAFRRAADGMGVGLLPYPEGMLNATASAMAKEFKSERPGDFLHLNLAGDTMVLRHVLEQAETRFGPDAARRARQGSPVRTG